MDKKQFEQYNSIPKEKFTFATQGEMIHDKKLDTKAVSHAKDSFRRFCKNKASVVAAIILGIIILLAIFGPVVTGADIDRVSVREQFLEPKLFEAGTGFWDGTKKYTNVIYDTEGKVPAGFYAPAVMNLVVDEEPTAVNMASPFGKGGFVMFENQMAVEDDTPDDGEDDEDVVTTVLTSSTLSSDTFYVSASGNYMVNIALGDTNGINEGQLGQFRIYLKNGDDIILLKSWSTDYTSVALNLSGALQAKGIEEIADARLVFELKSAADTYSYLLIESCVFTANASETEAHLARLEKIGFTDATEMVLRAKDGLGVFPEGYWSCVGRKGVYASIVYYCSFTFDTYAAVYDQTEVVYAKSDMDYFESMGWCTYNPDIGPESFEKLSDDCPIESIVSQKVNSRTGELLEFTAMSYRYKQMGYKKMPKFIFGTDSSGVDVFSRMFAGLRTSLVLGVATFAFCFLFGLVWGSISGYFGGIVDLSMERFCDILGGVPWLVVMTLCILHLGNNFFTFFLALCMTGWMGTAGLTRTQFYRFKGMEHVLAARTLGARDVRLIFKHILPNSLGTIITSSVLMIPSVIYSEATLAYLNLGLQGVTSFGVMLANNQQYLQSHSYLIIIPSVVMALMMISFNLFGNGLRDAVNPTLKGSEG
ncbi:MAG: ABC transporter permease [Clostridiales bacterium]|nr:ABC transporter permease [Clostridiales bacterium]